MDADEEGRPIAVHLSGRRLPVESLLESWRIDEEWWRQRPVSRAYYRVLLEGGRTLDVYRDLVSGHWRRQGY